MKIGVLGSGVVGQVLSDGLIKAGHEVMRGTRDPARLAAWKAHHGAHAAVGTFAEAARFGYLVVLAVKGSAAVEVVAACGAELDGKAVLDTTNPIADAPPEDGVLRFFTGPNESLLERLQARAPGAHLVKAFSCVGSGLMVDPDLPGGPPTMFICGNDDSAKRQAAELARQLGWSVEDMGRAAAARAIEPLCMLWCIPGFRQNRWQHAFRLLTR
jgi:predicted dinucleotide-binding enzyme